MSDETCPDCDRELYEVHGEYHCPNCGELDQDLWEIIKPKPGGGDGS